MRPRDRRVPRRSRPRVLLLLLAMLPLLLACSKSAEKQREPVGARQSTLIALDPATKVNDCRPLNREPKCPGNKLPEQCGSWAGVELRAVRAAGNANEARDARCLCDTIDFQIPAELPVTGGVSGGAWDQADLWFRTAGLNVSCRYRSQGGRYMFEKCSDGSLSGQAKRSDWFELVIGHGIPGWGQTEVQLRLGEPDVVAGVVQEQVFYSNDPSIPGAALHVPRGSAPAFESFSLTVLNQVPLGTTIPNANNPSTSVSYVVDVHAASSDAFTFTSLPGAPCARIELPYDQATLDAVAGLNAEGTIQAHQLTTLSGITSGERVLTSAGPVTVDLARRTFSFCVNHLSFYVGTSGGYNAALTAASIQSTGGGTLGVTDLRGGAELPLLTPGETYELTLSFTRSGSGTATAWTSGGDVYLVAVNTPIYSPPPALPTVTALTAPTAWGMPVSTNVFAGGSIGVGATATFTLNLTCPSVSRPLNFCLRYSPAPADPNDSSPNGYFGECFTWDVDDPGTHPVPIAELCDNVDNDDDGSIDEGVSEPCYDGPAGTEGEGRCRGGNRICTAGSWGPCVGDILPATESCGNAVDDDCDGSVDEDGSTTYFADFDGDSFVDLDTTVTVCGAAPTGYHANPGTGDDCCDIDPRVNIDQGGWFAEPNACGTFNYDCNGVTDRELTTFSNQSVCHTLFEPPWCTADFNFDRNAPTQCGATSVQTRCELFPDGRPPTSGGVCAETDSAVIQRCR